MYLHKQIVSFEEYVLFWISISVQSILLSTIFATETKSGDIAPYINSLCQYESVYRHIFKKPARTVQPFQIRMTLFLIRCGNATTIIFPIVFVYGLHWGNPCKVTLLGFGLISECGGSGQDGPHQSWFQVVWTAALKIIVFILNHWFWSSGLHGGLFGIIMIPTMYIICLHEFIDG